MSEKKPKQESVYNKLREYNETYGTDITYDEETKTFYTTSEKDEIVKLPRLGFFIPKRYEEIISIIENKNFYIIVDEMTFEGKLLASKPKLGSSPGRPYTLEEKCWVHHCNEVFERAYNLGVKYNLPSVLNRRPIEEDLREYNETYGTDITYDEETKTFYTTREKKEIVYIPADYIISRFPTKGMTPGEKLMKCVEYLKKGQSTMISLRPKRYELLEQIISFHNKRILAESMMLEGKLEIDSETGALPYGFSNQLSFMEKKEELDRRYNLFQRNI